MDAPPPNQAQSASETAEPVDLSSSSPGSLHHALYARRADYTRPHRIRIKVGTWNVAACPGTDKDLATWFVDEDSTLPELSSALDPSQDSGAAATQPSRTRILAGDKIGLYALGLQEVVNLNPVTQYVYSDASPTDKWRLALEAAMPKGYTFVASEQMSGLLLLLYASPEVAPRIGSISTKVVGTGVGGWFGNKGATVARILLGEATRLVFINSHLSSGSDPSTVERRCWDVRTIVDRTRFDPVSIPGNDNPETEDRIGDEDFAFWFGDLNFRLGGIPGDDIRRLLTLHTTGEYGSSRRPETGCPDDEDAIIMRRASESTDGRSAAASATDDDSSTRRSPSPEPSGEDDASVDLPDPDDFDPDPQEDPTSLQATLDSLLPHDQLQQAVKRHKVFHDGWREGPISFLPSYKYDVGTVGVFDSSEKKRAPSWCDRILFRTRLDRERYEEKLREEANTRRRDEEMKARGIDRAGDDDEVLFDYDPENDGDTEPAGQPGLDYDEYEDTGGHVGLPAGNQDGSTADCISLETYTSYQRVTSSDHKPVAAIFTLDFDAVVPELKADVYAEVARELDRAENEGRPSITIVVEGSQSGSGSVDVGDIRYLERRTAYLTLANTGRVPATLSFIEKAASESPEDGSLDRHWLEASLSRTELSGISGEEAVDLGKEVTLEPGETVTASIQVFVGRLSQARLLNEGRASLDEVLVLRVADGRDHFIPVRAVWLPTCIGRSIDELIRVPDGGIRRLVKSLAGATEGKQYAGALPNDLAIHRSAPKELFKLIEALETLTDRTLADEQMLGSYTIPRDKPGWPFEDSVADPHEHLVPSVIDALDTDRPIADAFLPEANPCQRLETVAEVLVHFLQGLTDGVVSATLWSKIEQAPIKALGQAPPSSSGAGAPGPEAVEDDKMAILDVLTTSPNHNICFVFLTTTLARVVAELAPVQKGGIGTLGTAASASPYGGAIGAIGALGRRSLSFRQSLTIGPGTATASSVTDAIAAVERRRARERKVAQIFGHAVCRAPETGRDKDRKILEGKQSTVVELFIRKLDSD